MNKADSRVFKIFFTITLFILTVSAVALSFKFDFGSFWVYLVIDLFIVVSELIILCVDGKQHKAVWRCAIIVYPIAICALYAYYFIVKYDLLHYLSELENLKRIILATGNWGIAVFFVLTLLQVVILPIPAAITVLAGTLIYGPVTSFLVSAIATFVGSLIAFIIGRKVGRKLLNWLFDSEKIDKYADILGKKGKVPFIVMMLLPFFPDDVICMSAGITNMSLGFFSVSVALTRSVYIFFVAFFGDGRLIPFSGWGIPVWIAIFAACIGLSVFAGKHYDKKEVEEIPEKK